MKEAQVGIIMGSQSDLSVMQQAADILTTLGVTFEMTIVSAHRTQIECLIMQKTHIQKVLK